MGVMDRDRCIKVSGLLGVNNIYGEDLPVRFVCALAVKEGTEILSQTKHKRSAPEQWSSGVCCVPLYEAHRLYTQAVWITRSLDPRYAGRRSQLACRISQFIISQVAGRSTQDAARMSQDAARSWQLAARSSRLAARSSGTRYKSQARSSQLACPNRNSIHFGLMLLVYLSHGQLQGRIHDFLIGGNQII